MQTEGTNGVSRRDLLTLIGLVAGSAAMYQAMTSLGLASESGYKGPIKLEGSPKGASVLVLGAGLAGLTAALELRNAGYTVKVLDFGIAKLEENIAPDGANILGGQSSLPTYGSSPRITFAGLSAPT